MRVRALPAVLALALFVAPVPSRADVPPNVIERVVHLRLQTAEAEHLSRIGKITAQEYRARKAKNDADERALAEPYRRNADDMRKAADAIRGEVSNRLALLQTQWREEQKAAEAASSRRRAQHHDEIMNDGRKGAELQRQRLMLQKQRDSGSASAQEFAARDKELLGQITQLRQKWANDRDELNFFDDRLRVYTRDAVANPDLPFATSSVRLSEAPDWDADVKRAADLWVQKVELELKREKNLVERYGASTSIATLDMDIDKLRSKYPGRLDEFFAAFERLGASRVQALRAQYNPQSLSPPVQVQVRPAPSRSPWDSLMPGLPIAVGVILVGIIIWLFFKRIGEPKDDAPPISGHHGTARWAEPEVKPSPNNDVAHGVTFGKSSHPRLLPFDKGAPVTSTPATHTLVVAQTRSGKGTTVLVPTLLRYRDSMLVIDPKGENAAITARARQMLGQKVYVVNPWGELEDDFKKLGLPPASYNPLDCLHRDDPNIAQHALALAEIIIPPGTGKEGFWQGSATNILKCVFMWLAYKPGEKPTLARAREIVTMPKAELREILIDMVASGAYGGTLKEDIGQVMEITPELYASVMYNLNVNTQFISDPRVKAATSSSSFSMDKIRSEAMTVYLVVPFDAIKSNSPLLRLIIAAAMRGMKSKEAQKHTRHRCMFMIDEFGAMGRIQELPSSLAAMTGYGIDFTLATQTLAQLKATYQDEYGALTGNCAYTWYTNVADPADAKSLSEQLGKATVTTLGKSVSTGANPGGATEGTSYSYGEMGRPLLYPEEVQGLGRTASILLKTGELPKYLRPVEYFNLQKEYAHLKADHPEIYWHPPLHYDRNPIHDREEAARRHAEEQRKRAAEERRLEAERQKKADEQRKAARHGLAGVAGMAKLKELLRKEVIGPLREPEKYAKFQIGIPNGILLYGPHGCGKTFIVQKLAEELGYHFHEMKASTVGSKYIHETALLIAKAFAEAKAKSPAIMFIDEFDALVPNRKELRTEDSARHEEVNEFLTHLNNAARNNVLVIGATNHPDRVDPAVLRSGRMDKRIFVAPPDRDAREELFRMELRDRPHGKLNFKGLADITENYTNSDITMVVQQAGHYAVQANKQEIDADAMAAVIQKMKPSLTAADISRYARFADLERL